MSLWATLLAAVVVGTWNGNWFPSHRAEHRAAPEVEERTIAASGQMLAEAVRALDPLGTNDLILCFNEIRNREAAVRLTAAVGAALERTNLSVAAISAYRRRDRFDMQQDVIATTLPVVQGSWSRWWRDKERTPPRGTVQADLLLSPAVTARVQVVHLKSNYGQRTAEQIALNRHKRTQAVKQLLSFMDPMKGPLLIAGDMNADRWKPEFAAEEIFGLLERANFHNTLEALPASERATYIGRGKGRDSALDYIFTRGWATKGGARVFSAQGCSDHKPVFVLLQPPEPVPAKPRMWYN